MAVAHSAASESHTGTTGSTSQASFSWTHTQTGTPQGVLVFVHTNANADYITSVTYGGTALTRVSGGQAIDTATEPCRTDLFFLGSGLASGNQSVVVNRTNNATVMYASAATVTAATNTMVTGIVLLQDNGTLTEQNVNDGSPGTNSLRYAAGFSGLTVGSVSAGANSTVLTSIGFTNNACGMVRETTAGQGSRPVGFSAATDDRAFVHVAVRELRALTVTAVKGSYSISGGAEGPAAGLRVSRKVPADVGAIYLSHNWGTGYWDGSTWTQVGDNATLRRTRSLLASAGGFSASGVAAGTLAGRYASGAAGAYAVSGVAAALSKASPKTVTADAGSFAIGGVAAGTYRNRLTTGAVGTYSVSGVAATLARSRTMAASAGAFTATGIAATTRVGRLVDASLGKFFIPERNLAPHSEDFTNAAWQKTLSSVTGNAGTAPDGTLTADRFTPNATASVAYVSRLTSYAYEAGRTETLSIYVKAAGYTICRIVGSNNTIFGSSGAIVGCLFDLTGVTATPDRVEVSGAITAVGDGWYRCSITFTPTTTASFTPQIIRSIPSTDGTNGLLIWGAQIDGASAPSSYDPTGSAVAAVSDLRTDRRLAADTGAVSITGVAAVTKAGRRVTGAVGAFAVTGVAATLKPARLLAASTGASTVAGVAAGLLTTRRLTSATGSFVIAGNAATIKPARLLISAAGSYTVAGVAATTKAGRYISAAVGACAVTGVAAGLAPARRLTCATGAIAITGNAATLTKASASVLPATTGTVVVAGIAAVTARSRIHTAAAGAFSITGVAAAPKSGRQLTASTGSCVITGNAATLVKTGARSLTAETGTVAVSGTAATLRRALTATAGTGAISIGLGLAGLQRTRTVYAGSGAFTATGNDAALARVSAFLADPGAFAVTGISASLERGLLVAASPGAYTVTGYSTIVSGKRRHVLIF